MYVEGLRSNIISISQLFDEGLTVVFITTQCKAFNEKVKIFGVRYGNNCYIWDA